MKNWTEFHISIIYFAGLFVALINEYFDFFISATNQDDNNEDNRKI